MAALHAPVRRRRASRGYWEQRAAGPPRGLNDACWNGRFYTHFVKLTPVTIAGVDEAAQLSLSNPMDINRGAADHGAGGVDPPRVPAARRRGPARSPSGSPSTRRSPTASSATSGWWPGAYCNGGIMPLVGGELARAAFEHGFEAYGADILARYYALVAAKGETYLWYFPGRAAEQRRDQHEPRGAADRRLGVERDGVGAGRGARRRRRRRPRLRPGDASRRDGWPPGVDEAEVSVGLRGVGRGVGYRSGTVPRRPRSRSRLDARACSDVDGTCCSRPGLRCAPCVRRQRRRRPLPAADVESSRYVDFRALRVRDGRGRRESSFGDGASKTKRGFLGSLAARCDRGVRILQWRSRRRHQRRDTHVTRSKPPSLAATCAAQFQFPPGLAYFNTAGLGASPRVGDATASRPMMDREEAVAERQAHRRGRLDADPRQVRGAARPLVLGRPRSPLSARRPRGSTSILNGLPLGRGDEVVTSTHEHPALVIPLLHKMKTAGIVVRTFEPDSEVAVRATMDRLRGAAHAAHAADLRQPRDLHHGPGLPGRRHRPARGRARGSGSRSTARSRWRNSRSTSPPRGAHFYTASAHKFLMAPKRTGILYVRQDRLDDARPDGRRRLLGPDDVACRSPADAAADGAALRVRHAERRAGLRPRGGRGLRRGARACANVWEHNRALAEICLEGLRPIPGVEVLVTARRRRRGRPWSRSAWSAATTAEVATTDHAAAPPRPQRHRGRPRRRPRVVPRLQYRRRRFASWCMRSRTSRTGNRRAVDSGQ